MNNDPVVITGATTIVLVILGFVFLLLDFILPGFYMLFFGVAGISGICFLMSLVIKFGFPRIFK